MQYLVGETWHHLTIIHIHLYRFFEDDDDDFAEYDDGTDTDHMFHHFHDEMQKQMDSLHQQMEEMFKQFGAVDFPSGSVEL